jgi:hypothetical protein
MYRFSAINHPVILTHAVLVALTPLIPIPILDDWVKNMFLRRMVRQLTDMRGQPLSPDQVEALIQEDFWDSCVEGCFNLGLYLIRELLSKIFFLIEWRRAFQLIGVVFYTGFLIDSALLDGYEVSAPDGSSARAARLREAVRRTRYGANLRLIQRLVRENIRPLAFLRAAWLLAGQAVASLPKLLIRIPGTLWSAVQAAPGQVAQGAVSTWARVHAVPRQIRSNLAQLVQVFLGKQKPRELILIEKIVQSLQNALLRLDTSHFDQLHDKLLVELNNVDPGN